MDNVSRLHGVAYQRAREYARQGKHTSCLDICWELRLKPGRCHLFTRQCYSLTYVEHTTCVLGRVLQTDHGLDLSLYRRAHVNLLIAAVVDVREHPDAAKYAQECIDLVDIVKAEGFANNLSYLDRISSEAGSIKAEIEREAASMLQQTPQIGSAAGGRLDSAILGAKMVQKLVDDLGTYLYCTVHTVHAALVLTCSGASSSSRATMTLAQRAPTKIEGMYKVL